MSTSTEQPHELIRTLDAIHKVLDGTYWNPDTLEQIADLLRGAGYQIRSPEEIKEEEERPNDASASKTTGSRSKSRAGSTAPPRWPSTVDKSSCGPIGQDS